METIEVTDLGNGRVKIGDEVYISEKSNRVIPANQFNGNEVNKSLEAAKAELRQKFNDGEATDCPCCKQLVKKYKRKLSSSMAYGLIVLFKAPPGWINIEDYFHAQNIPHSIRGDVRKLRHWGLIEKKSGTREDGSTRTGEYRITEKGAEFVRGEIRVRSHYKEFNKNFLGFEGEQITIRQALGNKFKYNELMSN